MTKPTHASVTEKYCTCDYLQNQADELGSPIVFDAEAAEYQISFGDGMLVIYHCPFCGGAAPESKRALLFAQIPDVEEERLASYFSELKRLRKFLRGWENPTSRACLPPKILNVAMKRHGYNIIEIFAIRICRTSRKSVLKNVLTVRYPGNSKGNIEVEVRLQDVAADNANETGFMPLTRYYGANNSRPGLAR